MENTISYHGIMAGNIRGLTEKPTTAKTCELSGVCIGVGRKVQWWANMKESAFYSHVGNNHGN